MARHMILPDLSAWMTRARPGRIIDRRADERNQSSTRIRVAPDLE